MPAKPRLFTPKTFAYFEGAQEANLKPKQSKKWFEQHKEEFETNVRDPFSTLVREMDFRIGSRVGGIAIAPRRISRPLRGAKGAARRGLVRASVMFYFAEKSTSRFEWNPGFFMQLGDEKEDNVIGVGLYGPSSRQIKRLRKAFTEDHEVVDRLLKDRKLKKYWGAPADEKYKRFPKDFSPDHPAAKYLWYKQFFLTKNFTRKEVMAPDFMDTVLKSFEAALPFLYWLRESIGVYDRIEWAREKASQQAWAEERGRDERYQQEMPSL